MLGSGAFIVLATRNGEPFLVEQLDSLLAQSFTDWTLLARDDHSMDGTRAILGEYAARDGRIHVLPPPAERLGSAARNFSGLLQEALERGAEFVFCCDQDDVWAPGKLEQMLGSLKEIPGPALVHHDLLVTDEHLEPVANSYWALMALAPNDESRPQRLLSRNEVTGCAMACNRSLLEIALPLPQAGIMHDWWLALHAGFFGKLLPVTKTLVSYRQHGANVIGAKSYRAGLDPRQNWWATWRRGNQELQATIRQARDFQAAVSDRSFPNARIREALDTYCDMPRLSRWRRIPALRRCAIWRKNCLLDTVLVLRVLLLAREPD